MYIHKMFCCVYFQKADRKNLIWQIIKDYSTAILVAQLRNYKKVPFFHIGTPPQKILRTGLGNQNQKLQKLNILEAELL